MMVATTTYCVRYDLLRHSPGLGFPLAAVAMVLLALGPDGGGPVGGIFVWAFYLMPSAGYLGIAAVLVSVLALIFGRAVIGWRGVAIGIVAVIAGGLAAYTPIHYYAMRGRYPPIDDITTDTANPPAFVAVVAARLAEGDNPATYGGARIAQQQRRAYPDIAPLALAIPPARAFSHALDTAQRMGWTIVDGSGHRQDRGQRQEPVVWLHRRHRGPHHRVGYGQQGRLALLVAAWTGRFRRKCRPHPRLSGRAASVCRRAELAETAEPREITQTLLKSGPIVP